MKRNILKYSLGLLSIGLLLGSCEKDAEGTLFDTAGKNQFSVGAKVRTVELIPQDNNSFKVEVTRVDASTSTTVNISLKLAETVPSGTFTLVQNFVDFNPGEFIGYATIKYEDINKLSPTSQYKMELSIAKEDASPSNLTTMAITAFRKLTYAEYGVGSFTSKAFGGSWDQPIWKANEGDVYILKECYDYGYDIQMVIVDGKATIASQPAWKHNTYGDVYIRTSAPAVVNGKTIVMTIEHYVPNLGSFGKFQETLTMP